MKAVLNITRWIVGLLFIFSGLIKANDPLGLSYKMLEFFEAWGFHFLDNYTLVFAITMNLLEVLAGVAVIIGWRMKIVSWFLLLLILFFTFLTGYVLYSGKVKECGCFGDCIPMTGIQTFTKDLILLALILLIFFFRGQTGKALFKPRIAITLLVLGGLLTAGCQFYVLKHLPFLDCLPYKKGNDLLEQMKIPAGAVPDSFAITFRYQKNNKIVEFDKNHFPADFDSTYHFIDRYDQLVRKGNASAAIADFSLRTIDGADSTSSVLQHNEKYILFFVRDFTDINDWIQDFLLVKKITSEHHIPFYVITSQAEAAAAVIKDVQIFKCDATVIKTAARANPSYFIMKGALILDKSSYTDVKELLLTLNSNK